MRLHVHENYMIIKFWYIWDDVVWCVGGHTLGFAHCSSFENRIHKFSPKQDIDPSLNPSFGSSLRSICPSHNKVRNAGTSLDSSSTLFDNAYYKLLLQGKSIFSSDQALLTHPTTKALVSKFAYSQEEFERAFVKSMIKMSSITHGGQQIRLDCKFVRWFIVCIGMYVLWWNQMCLLSQCTCYLYTVTIVFSTIYSNTLADQINCQSEEKNVYGNSWLVAQASIQFFFEYSAFMLQLFWNFQSLSGCCGLSYLNVHLLILEG